MTTDTDQTGLTGTKTWIWENYEGSGTVGEPHDGDIRARESISINYISDWYIPLVLDGFVHQYSTKDGWQVNRSSHLVITSDAVHLDTDVASWSNIVKVAKVEQGFDHTIIYPENGSLAIGYDPITPNSEIKIWDYVLFVIDSNGKIASVRATGGNVLDVSVAVFDTGSAHRVSGIVNETAGLSFDAPITPAEGQQIYVRWARYVNNI